VTDRRRRPGGPSPGPRRAAADGGRPVAFFSDGLRLAGRFYPARPRGRAAAPGVVFCHGFTATKELYLPPLARAFARAGLAALAFDYRGFGESEGPPGRLVPAEQVQDVRNALTFLGSRPGVDAGRLGLFGTSFGGGIAVAAGAADSRVRAVVSSVGLGDGGRWLRGMRPYWDWVAFRRRLEADRVRRVLTGVSERVARQEVAPPDPAAARAHGAARAVAPARRTRITLESAEAICEFVPEAVVGRLSPRPLLVVAAGEDMRVPLEESLALHERAGEPKALVVLGGAAHHDVYEPPGRDRLLAAVLPWLARALGAP
jgi:alpha-beta hydrolase superfamily lysophospholipase